MKKKFLVTAMALVIFMTGLQVFAAGKSDAGSSSGKLYVGLSMVSLEYEEWAYMAEGVKLFVESLPKGSAELVIMTGSEPATQVANIEAFIAKYGSGGILVCDPLTVSITPTIAAMCEEAGVYYCNLFNKEKDLWPTDYTKFVAFMTQDDEKSGYTSAKALFDSLGGRGNVLELYGVLGNDAAFRRNLGLKRALAEYPGIKLLDSQVANYANSEALTVTENWLAAYGSNINAIFTHSDNMALGAIEALKQAGLAGKIKVSGIGGVAAALDAIKEGTLLCTINNESFLIGGFGAAWAYAAKTGKINPVTMDQKKRTFYTKTILVTQNNVDNIINTYIKGKPQYDFVNLESAIDELMPNPKISQ
jgi:ABC-type sugar transport system substrate-binding protein